MLNVVTGIGLLITIFSAGYMKGEAGYSRFFAYLGLFVFAMTCLVMADNLVLLYLGWEGVGLCSYLLIGYYFERPAASPRRRRRRSSSTAWATSDSPSGIMLVLLGVRDGHYYFSAWATGTAGLLEMAGTRVGTRGRSVLSDSRQRRTRPTRRLVHRRWG